MDRELMPSSRQVRFLGAVSLLVVLAVVAAAAAGVGPFGRNLPDSDARALELANESAAATEEVAAYSYTVGGWAEATRQGEEIRAEYGGHGAVNATTREQSLEVTLGGDRERAYVRNHTAYVPCPYAHLVNVEDAFYPKTDLPANRSWRAYTLLGQQRRIFDMSHVYYRGTATVDGEPANVIVVVPDLDEYERLAAESPRLDGDRPAQSSVKNVTATLYLDRETALPRRVVVDRVHASGLAGPTMTEHVVYDVSYGPTTVTRPNETVQSEASCPEF